MEKNQKLLNAIAQKIYDKKGFNILGLDIQSDFSLYDFVIIAEGTVERHVQSLYRSTLEVLEEFRVPVFHVDGSKTGDWIVIDCGFLVVHLLIQELRERYALEELWRDGRIIDLYFGRTDG